MWFMLATLQSTSEKNVCMCILLICKNGWGCEKSKLGGYRLKIKAYNSSQNCATCLYCSGCLTTGANLMGAILGFDSKLIVLHVFAQGGVERLLKLCEKIRPIFLFKLNVSSTAKIAFIPSTCADTFCIDFFGVSIASVKNVTRM